jgi:cytoskeletal protein CcmA (bactofilin family)
MLVAQYWCFKQGIYLRNISLRKSVFAVSSTATNQKVTFMRLWKKRVTANHASTSVIDHGCEAEGRLTFVGTLALNGKFRGQLLTADTLFIGEDGEVEAEVQVGAAVVSGQIKGNITARERVELCRTARVFGNVTAPVLVLEEGAAFDGQCKTSRQELITHD